MQYTSKRAKNLSFNTVFSKMNVLAQKHETINLGHGFPDYPAPSFLKTAATQAIQNDTNQYTSARGQLCLRKAITNRMHKRYQIDYNPETDVTVTQGATEAIFATMMGLVNPGDEVILFEPCYSTYLPVIQLAGGIPRFYTLLPSEWTIDENKLTALFSNKTQLILINTPHNPTGKVFSDKELSLIAKLCIQHDVIALSDEVYDELVFDGITHYPLCTYPGMYERTVTISTLGKNFEVTGWKVGWTVSSPQLTESILRIHQYVSGSGTTPVQEAAAHALAVPQSFYNELVSKYEIARNYLFKILENNGFKPIMPYGTYFLMADFSNFDFDDDINFCQYLNLHVGITVIPSSTLYHTQLTEEIKMVRFAFCKKLSTLEEANKRLNNAQLLTLSGLTSKKIALVEAKCR